MKPGRGWSSDLNEVKVFASLGLAPIAQLWERGVAWVMGPRDVGEWDKVWFRGNC